jgi:hypothetical protein
MYFQLLLIITGALIIALLILLSIVLSYLSLAQRFRAISNRLITKAINISDTGLSVLLISNNPTIQEEYLALKSNLFEKRKSTITEFWEVAHQVIDLLEKFETQIPKNSDLHIKFIRLHHELYETVHDYNLEVSEIEKRLQKPFFSIVNGLILHIDSKKMSHLHEY